MAAKRPNFIVIMTDQHRADYMGCAGHPFLRTPAIDALAANGTRFTRFFVSSPVCMPNRATFMTGRLPSVNGARGNGLPLPLQANTFVDLLRSKGYRTALIGKSHLQTMLDNAPLWKHDIPDGLEAPGAGFEEALKPWSAHEDYDQENIARWDSDPTAEVDLPFYGYERVNLCIDHGDKVRGDYARWVAKKGGDLAKLAGPKNAKPANISVPQAWRTSVPEELYPTRYIQEHACQAIEDYAKDPDTPFFMSVTFPDPHHPFTPPGKYWDMYKPEQVTLPKSFYARIGNEDGVLQRAQRSDQEKGFNRDNTMVFLPVAEREAKEAIALSCGMISMIDDAIAAIAAKLKQTGVDHDTIVIFTADHGDFMADHGLLLKGPLHLQSIVKVPFIWCDPQRRGASVCDAVSGTIDIPSTILTRAGLAGFNGMQGRSLLPEIADGADHGTGAHIVEEESQRALFGLPAPVRMRTLVTDDWRMTLYDSDRFAELYDLKNDPDELNNLWDDPASLGARAELLARMVRENIRLSDLSPVPQRRA
jgi:arylsulfatase A-like enzyme